MQRGSPPCLGSKAERVEEIRWGKIPGSTHAVLDKTKEEHGWLAAELKRGEQNAQKQRESICFQNLKEVKVQI